MTTISLLEATGVWRYYLFLFGASSADNEINLENIRENSSGTKSPDQRPIMEVALSSADGFKCTGGISSCPAKSTIKRTSFWIGR